MTGPVVATGRAKTGSHAIGPIQFGTRANPVSFIFCDSCNWHHRERDHANPNAAHERIAEAYRAHRRDVGLGESKSLKLGPREGFAFNRPITP